MSVRIKKYSGNGIEQPEHTDRTWDQNTSVDSEGFSETFGINEVKNYLDDARGDSVATGAPTGSNIVADRIPYGDSRS